MKKLLAVLTALFMTACFCCAAYADLAPIPEEWLHSREGGEETPATPAGQNGEGEETAETPPADPAPTDPEPVDPAPAPVPQTGCAHLSVTLVVLAGGIACIAGGVLGYTVARHRREVPVK